MTEYDLIEGAATIPTRQKLIGKNKVEEWPWYFGKGTAYTTFINDERVVETYDDAVARLEREQE